MLVLITCTSILENDGEWWLNTNEGIQLYKSCTSKWINPFTPRSQSICNFSVHYHYIVNQTGDENKENHQLGDIV